MTSVNNVDGNSNINVMQSSPIASNNNQDDYDNGMMRPYRIISSNIRDDYQSQDGNNINTMPSYRIISSNNKDNYQNQNINNIDTTTTNIEESENSEDENQTITMIMTTQPVATKRFTAAKTTMIFSIIVITILLLLILAGKYMGIYSYLNKKRLHKIIPKKLKCFQRRSRHRNESTSDMTPLSGYTLCQSNEI
ncbi:unnamed protein product [Adineta steineri]|uniref:Uncharacterized protein n=1 Tax=Adineta steineri TaxID=433720 RepID=A0A814WT40_9BILA|nr:unnamed protein product [Adineta steineri]CAF1230879.1 unnamed protein product [Adineta steineri]CAF3568622.1 unnamed protein product [Adineta steineri]CAF3815137.1 unnamed protein product [Adineta steineri]